METVSATAMQCFVISPMVPRRDKVFRDIFKPACAKVGYTAVLADRQLSQNIRDEIVTSLAIAPMVIAYLGSADPHWNNNVILELGYRLATRLPFIIVCDDVPDLDLPFQIKNDRVEVIPRNYETDSVQIQEIIDRIIARISESDQHRRGLLSNQAVAVIHAPKESIIPDNTFYVAASKRATDLFGVNGKLVGRTLAQFVTDRKHDMHKFQYEAFCEEQASLAVNVAPEAPIVIARKPIVFRNGPNKDRAYLPIIVDYQQVGTVQEFTVLYIDVTLTTKYILDSQQERWCYDCNLTRASAAVPAATNDKDRADRVFLAYNTEDRAFVEKLYDRLTAHGCDPWLDIKCINSGDMVLDKITEGLGSCRAALICVGKKDFGKFQQQLELPTLINLMMEKGMHIVPVLLDQIDQPPHVLLRNLKWVKYEEADSDSWVQQFLKAIMLR